MTAWETLVAAMRARKPLTPDLEERLRRGRRGAVDYDLWIKQCAARVSSSFLDQLTDEELALRLAYDEAAHRECGQPADDDAKRDIDSADREVAGDLAQLGREVEAERLLAVPLVSAEQLRLTRAEVERRADRARRPQPKTRDERYASLAGRWPR